MTDTTLSARVGATMFNKVPKVIAIFWIIKVLSTTVGETFADYVNDTLGFGLVNTTIVMAVAFVAALAWQMSRKSYYAPAYWLTVVLVSIFGTLITDNLTDGLGVPLMVTTPIFAVLLAIVFTVWWREERTLSIKSINTRRRESFYWLAILTTFALGTAAGDLIGEQFSLGYGWSLALFAGIIVAIVVAWQIGLDTVLAFWMAYIMTRPLGASLGDLLSQGKSAGGLGVGTTATSAVFGLAILALVAYLTTTKVDVIEPEVRERELVTN